MWEGSSVRLTPLRLALLFGAALLLLGPATALTQGPGGGKRGKGDPNGGGFDKRGKGSDGGFQPGGGPGFGGFNPADMAARIFDRYANGKDVIVIAEMQSQRDPTIREKAQAYAQAKGITNGQLTRDQFAGFMQEQMSQWQNGGRPGGGSPSAGLPGPGGDPTRNLDTDAENSFRRHDKNNDGVLTTDEMPRALRDELEKWDKNKDGVVDLAEYKEYYKARMQYLRPDRQQGDNNGYDPNNRDGTAQPDDSQGDDKRPTVYKFGNLPKELPAWFAQLDTDKDGQVGLYEWKKAGGKISKFMEMDRNGDGFLTVEEVLRYQKMVAAAKKAEQAPGATAAVDEEGNPIPTEDATAPTMPAFNFGRGQQGNGMGIFPGGGPGGPGNGPRNSGGPRGGPGGRQRGGN
jgi:Ca2+-binding EF-hand superfamily protein